MTSPLCGPSLRGQRRRRVRGRTRARTCSSPTPGSTGSRSSWGAGSLGRAPSRHRPRAELAPVRPVRAGAATPLPVLARQAAEAGWAGLTWAVGVPGSVGGAVRMNAGGHGADMAGCLLRYTWVDLLGDAGGTDDVARLRLRVPLAHRSGRPSWWWRPSSRSRPATPPRNRPRSRPSCAGAAEHQPGGSNAGSVFTNPPGDPAGKLIEAAGLKGFRLGTAHVSEKHANFIQAEKGGRADDVRALMEHVRRQVLAHAACRSRAEVRLLGFEEGETGAMARHEGAGSEPHHNPVAPGTGCAAGPAARSIPAFRPGAPRSAASRAAAACAWSALAAVARSWRSVHGRSCIRPCSRPGRSPWSGAKHETTAQIEAAAGLSGHPPLLDVNAGRGRARPRPSALGAGSAWSPCTGPMGCGWWSPSRCRSWSCRVRRGPVGRAERAREGSRRGGHPSTGADGVDGTPAARGAREHARGSDQLALEVAATLPPRSGPRYTR